MGLIKAAAGAVGGTLGDQWRDFLTVPPGVAPTAALFPAVRVGADAGQGSNLHGSQAVLSNGSRVVVPEGYGLLLFQDGELTGFAVEPGRYIWDSDEINSQSVFAGDGFHSSVLTQSWERFKFGGRPGTQQLALFVSLKELPNNRFGTQSVIYWDDAYFNAQVGAVTHGTYSVRIVDPILFVKQFVPASYLQNGATFDFTDRSNPASKQLFSEVVGSLASAFSVYANDAARGNRIARIQSDSIGFAQSLAQVLDSAYQWQAGRGLTVSQVTIVGIEYDEATQELLRTVQRADALSGARGNANLQASVAAGMEAAGETGGSGAILGMGMAANSAGVAGLMQNPVVTEAAAATVESPADLIAQLEPLKRALDAGLITQQDYDDAKKKALGLS